MGSREFLPTRLGTLVLLAKQTTGGPSENITWEYPDPVSGKENPRLRKHLEQRTGTRAKQDNIARLKGMLCRALVKQNPLGIGWPGMYGN